RPRCPWFRSRRGRACGPWHRAARHLARRAADGPFHRGRARQRAARQPSLSAPRAARRLVGGEGRRTAGRGARTGRARDLSPRERSQAEFLFDNGLASIVADARRRWEERAHIADLDALKHRSRITEADALTDPTGLGAFRVLEWWIT